ncbi:MAG: hypothetical protein RI947_194 [Candidatus Parcubacteria bacterium]
MQSGLPGEVRPKISGLPDEVRPITSANEVGMVGLEPTASASRTLRSSHLSYIP